MTTISLDDVYAAAIDDRDTRESRQECGRVALFECLECGRQFATVRAARKAVDQGCPRCGGTDIDPTA